MYERYGIGNAQTIGRREVQSNYFSVFPADTVFAVLADGGIDHVNGRRAAIVAVEESIAWFHENQEHVKTADFYDSLVLHMIEMINDRIYLGRKPNLSLTIAYREEEGLFYFNIGENRIFLSDGSGYILLKERRGYHEIKGSHMVGLISNGIYEALNEVELLGYLAKNTDPYDKAQQIIEGVNRKNIIMAKNSTIILVEGGL